MLGLKPFTLKIFSIACASGFIQLGVTCCKVFLLSSANASFIVSLLQRFFTTIGPTRSAKPFWEIAYVRNSGTAAAKYFAGRAGPSWI